MKKRIYHVWDRICDVLGVVLIIAGIIFTILGLVALFSGYKHGDGESLYLGLFFLGVGWLFRVSQHQMHRDYPRETRITK